jgi:hypothetical protein
MLSNTMEETNLPSSVVEPGQRRRRSALLLLALALALAVGVGVAAAHRSVARGRAAGRQQTIPGEVNDIVTRYDSAFVAGHYTRACALIDQVTGMSALNGETSSVGIRGSCEARLAGTVHLLGRSFLTDLAPAWKLSYIPASIQVIGSSARGFTATAPFSLPNHGLPYRLSLPARATRFWIVVQQRTAHSRVLLTCPPLMCVAYGGRGPGFLSTYLSYKKTHVHRKR